MFRESEYASAEDAARAWAAQYRKAREDPSRGPNSAAQIQAEDPDAFDYVLNATMQDPDPLGIVELLVAHAEGDESVLGMVGAGPLEDVLSFRPEFLPAAAERCRIDPGWAYAATYVSVDRRIWLSMPAALRALVPEPLQETSEPAKRKKRKSPSKRQDRRGRS